jgi:4-carboxymuconolactone decarboxylase
MPIGASDPGALTPAQRRVYDRIAAGPRGSVPKPFLAMLDAPEIAGAVQAVGATIRFGSTLDPRLREVAILAAAAAWGSRYEWDYHVPIAHGLGVEPEELAAIREGSGRGLAPVEASTVEFVFAAVRERRADREALSRISALAGRTGATEITAIAGYYPLLALFLDAADIDEPRSGDA